jgi:glucosamine-phosphate N-acetyltransferase
MPISTTTAVIELTESLNNIIISNSEDYLFDDQYLCPEVQKNLHDGYKLYPLRSNDFERGYLDVLSVLTEVGDHDINTWKAQFNFMKKHNDTCK